LGGFWKRVKVDFVQIGYIVDVDEPLDLINPALITVMLYPAPVLQQVIQRPQIRDTVLNPATLFETPSHDIVVPAQNHQRAKEGEISLARRRWQEGTVYVRKSKKLPDAWWGRFIETIETSSGPVRVHRNIRLGEAGTGAGKLTKPLAKRALRDHVDRANNYQPHAVKVLQMGKAATLFSVFAKRWQEEVLIHKKASTQAAVKSHINTSLLPEFGKLAIGDVDSECVQAFLNRLAGKMSPKSVKNVWTTLRIMWNSAVRMEIRCG